MWHGRRSGVADGARVSGQDSRAEVEEGLCGCCRPKVAREPWRAVFIG